MTSSADLGLSPDQRWGDAKSGDSRASILAFLVAERMKFERAYNEHIASERPEDAVSGRDFYDDKTLRLDAKVSLLRTLIAYIERGDDMVPR